MPYYDYGPESYVHNPNDNYNYYADPSFGPSFLKNYDRENNERLRQIETIFTDIARKMTTRVSEFVLVTLQEGYIREHAYMDESEFDFAKAVRDSMRVSSRDDEPDESEGKEYERSWEFYHAWTASRTKKVGGGWTSDVMYSPENVLYPHPGLIQHWSPIKRHKGSSKYTLADMLNTTGSTSDLWWNYREVAYWDEFAKDFSTICELAMEVAASEFDAGLVMKRRGPAYSLV